MCSSDLCSPAGLDQHQDQTSSVTLSSRRPTASPLVPEGGVRRLSSISSIEETLTSHNQTFTLSPASPATDTPTFCDSDPSDFVGRGEGSGGSQTRIPTSRDGPPSSSSPLSEKSRLLQLGEDDQQEEQSVSLQHCQQTPTS
uniref:Uncharacterized protein n=1 Tax=Gasterosteus aculeatus TaxID=69293 RepID=G3NKX1_GASAC